MDNNTTQNTASGEKYLSRNGIKAIKDGIKVSVEHPDRDGPNKQSGLK